jgi:hypothetical protein
VLAHVQSRIDCKRISAIGQPPHQLVRLKRISAGHSPGRVRIERRTVQRNRRMDSTKYHDHVSRRYPGERGDRFSGDRAAANPTGMRNDSTTRPARQRCVAGPQHRFHRGPAFAGVTGIKTTGDGGQSHRLIADLRHACAL